MNAAAIYGKGMKNGKNLKLAQTGGSSGSIVPASLQDTPMDFDSFAKAGVALGSGALLICDSDTCVIDLAKVLLNFFRKESCGKCTPCRVGTHRAHEILDGMVRGGGQPGNVEELRQLAEVMFDSSFCGLGQSVPIPMRSALGNFAEAFAAAENRE
mgnify:CR=1 FL=1